MTDLFQDKAADWDQRPLPQQISEGVFAAVSSSVPLSEAWTVLDFGAGTGLIASKIAPFVGRLIAVDISPAMLEQLKAKAELSGKLEVHCQNLLEEPLAAQVDLVVSAMAMHHVEDTRALVQTLFDHLVPGGRVALADLDREEGDFHPAGTEGVFHAGFARESLAELMAAAGFCDIHFTTAVEVHKDEKTYPIFCVTASRPA